MVSQSNPGRIEQFFREGTAIDRAVEEAVAAALARHKREGQSVVVAENGSIRLLGPEEIPDSE